MEIKGFVFDSSNNPISGVLVSDGMNCTKTDESGAFVLPTWKKASLVYCNVLTTCHDDWYLPYDENCKEYIFHLSPADTKAEKHNFLHLSDTEIMNTTCECFLPFVIEQAKKNCASFLMHGGDICGEDAMIRHRDEMSYKTVGIPVRYSIGNHDFLGGSYGEKRYEELYGPIWYSFDMGKIRYVVLSIPKGSGFSSGYCLDEQYTWLENNLKTLEPDQKVIIFRHDSCGESESYVVELQNRTYDLPKMGLIAWVQGHAHTNFVMEKNGILHACSSRPDCGGIDNTAGSIRLGSVDGVDFTTKVLFNTTATDFSSDAIWTTKLRGNIEFASLLEIGDRLIAATCDDGYAKECGIYCLNANDGTIKWFYPTKNSIKNEISTDGETIFAEDCQGTVYAVSAENGELVWSTALTETPRHTRGCAIVRGDKVYAGTGREPVFLDKTNGEILFRGEKGKKGELAPGKTCFNEDGKTVYFNAQWLKLCALDSETGKVKWERFSQKDTLSNHGAFWYRTNTPLCHQGKIYAFGFGHGAIADCETGEEFLHVNVPFKTEIVGHGLIEGDTLYMPTGKQGLMALDKSTLEEKWRYPVDGAQIYTCSYAVGASKTVEATPVIIEDEIVFPANDGSVYFYDKSKPELHNKVKLAFPTLTTPIFKNDHFFAASFDGTIGKYPIPKKK